MFSKSKRFNQSVPSNPAVGQYDVSKTPFAQLGGAILFPKDKRFKEPVVTNGNEDTNLLDISNCSTVSTVSTKSLGFSSLNNSVFATPGKRCGKTKSLNDLSRKHKSHQAVAEDKDKDKEDNLTVQISKLQKEIEQLRSENVKLQKVQVTGTYLESIEALNARVVSLSEEVERLKNENKMLNTKLSELESSAHERQILQSNFSALNDELEKLRTAIDKEIIRNKELLREQSKYECSIETMQADVDLANSQAKALQGQINSLEQVNADMSENREDLEEQCTKLHGMTIALQEEKLILQERLDDVENAYKNVKSSKESLEKGMSLYTEQQDARVEVLEYTLYEKVTSLTELNEQRKALEETLDIHKNNIATLEHDLAEALDIHKKTETEMKNIKEEKEFLTVSLKDLGEKHERVVNETEQEMSQLRDEMKRKEQQSLQNLQSMTKKCETLENQLAALQEYQVSKIECLQKELELSNASLDKNQEGYRTLNMVFKDVKKDYDMECENRLQLQQDLYTERESLKKVNQQLIELQGRIAKLQENEKEQRTTAETVSRKLGECNQTINGLEKKMVVQQDIIKENNRFSHAGLEGELQSKIKFVLFERTLKITDFRGEIERLKESLSKSRDKNRSLAAEEEKAIKLKEEIGKRLVETQTKLSQKEIDLQSCEKEFEDYVLKSKDEESWKTKYEELERRIAPFQEQLDAYEFEKEALLSRNSESQSEIEKLGHEYAKLLGHQNQKQKIRHVLKLKEDNANLRKDVARLQEESIKQKREMRKLEEKVNKATGGRRFDPSLAFKHGAVNNKENTPLKTRTK